MDDATRRAIERLDGALPGRLASDPDTLETYGRDWTKVHPPRPSCVVFPASTGDVQTVLAIAHEEGAAIVPSGGRTGLAGGAVATRGEIVLSLARMTRMDPVDLAGGTVRVEAGAVTEAVHAHVGEHGLLFPIDFASKGSSQIGGNIATNAGGVRVIRYGLTRQWVTGLQVVLAGGHVLELGGGLKKNNTGLDLRQLFIGSEGTLGVITEATLELTRKPEKVDVLLFAVADLAAVLALFTETRRGPFTLAAYEFFTAACQERVLRHRKLRPPFGSPASHYVLVEAESAEPVRLEAWLEALLEKGIVEDGVLAQHSGEARDLWALREGISESLSATGTPHKNDIALPIARLEAFCRELGAVFEARYPGFEICLFGHVGDGNLHVNVMKPEGMTMDDFLGQARSADEVMFALVKAHGGSVSAEHGIGLLKKPYLHYTRAEEEIAIMRGVKALLDPRGILNPGKIF